MGRRIGRKVSCQRLHTQTGIGFTGREIDRKAATAHCLHNATRCPCHEVQVIDFDIRDRYGASTAISRFSTFKQYVQAAQRWPGAGQIHGDGQPSCRHLVQAPGQQPGEAIVQTQFMQSYFVGIAQANIGETAFVPANFGHHQARRRHTLRQQRLGEQSLDQDDAERHQSTGRADGGGERGG